jgi:hypothetical protein
MPCLERNRYRLCGGSAVGKSLEIRHFAVWRFEGGKVAEISPIHDQFARIGQADR